MKTSRSHIIAIGILFLLEGILLAANYTSGTYLIGWDNVMPEFDFKANIIRNVVGVWQEHRGLGLYDGMSHAANTLHTLTLWLLSAVLPQSMLRYAFIFGMHLLGGIGMYFLIRNVIPIPMVRRERDPNRFSETQGDSSQKPRNDKTIIIPLLGALFYQYSLITVQMFYTPLESFAIHFAYLPWLAWSALRVFETGKRREYFWFFLIVLLGSAQSFIATLFLPTALVLGAITLGRIKRTGLIRQIKTIALIWIGFFILNAYWLLPYVAGIPTNAPVIASAKINQMSSDENYLLNAAYGDIGNVLTLKGFMFSYQDTTAEGNTAYVMQPWINHMSIPIIIVSWIIACITLIGLIKALFRPTRYLLPFAGLFLLGVCFLAIDTPIVTLLNQWLRATIPFIQEAYRFPFTKFSIMYLIGYTVLFTYGCATIAFILSQQLQRIWYGVTGAMIIILSLPAFSGFFFYPTMRITLPADYKQTFAFFQTQNPDTRIAILPQPSYWSWKLYNFGLRGSGFFWYGIPQATLDRAFDPWSSTNEEYFWELSYAIYKKDPQLLNAVFKKYDIGYVVLDEHFLATAGHYRALFLNETKDLLGALPNIRQVATFGSVTIYRQQNPTDTDYIRISENLPTVNQYQWTDNDVAYQELGDYITQSTNQEPPARNASHNDAGGGTKTYIYPFRSLFTKRSIDEREFEVKETSNSATISSIPVPNATSFTIDKIATLVFDSDKENIINVNNTAPCYPLKQGAVKATMTTYLRLQATDNRLCLNFGMPELWHINGYLVSVIYRPIEGRPLTFALINKTAKHTEIETQLQKTPLRSLGFEGQATSNEQGTKNTEWITSYFILPPLASDGKGYDVYIANDAIGNQTSINDIASVRVYTIPYEEMISLKMNNAQLTMQNKEQNTISIIDVEHPNPAYYKVDIKTIRQEDNKTNPILILSQSFDEGWRAYVMNNAQCTINNVGCKFQNWLNETFPFLFGKELTNHVLVNNWENAWTIDNKTERLASLSRNGLEDNKTNTDLSVLPSNSEASLTVSLFFLPQLLQWIGFLLLPIPFIFILARRNHTR